MYSKRALGRYIAVDVDDVLAERGHAVAKRLYELGLIDHEVLEPKIWNFRDCNVHPEVLYQIQCKMFVDKRGYRGLSVVPGAREALRLFINEGGSLCYVTGRSWVPREALKMVMEDTEMWLADQGFPLAPVFFTEKKELVPTTWFVEDCPDMVKRIRRAGKRAIVFSRSYNRGLSGFRCERWTEFEASWRVGHVGLA
jgi:hypothetical protein